MSHRAPREPSDLLCAGASGLTPKRPLLLLHSSAKCLAWVVRRGFFLQRIDPKLLDVSHALEKRERMDREVLLLRLAQAEQSVARVRLLSPDTSG